MQRIGMFTSSFVALCTVLIVIVLVVSIDHVSRTQYAPQATWNNDMGLCISHPVTHAPSKSCILIAPDGTEYRQ